MQRGRLNRYKQLDLAGNPIKYGRVWRARNALLCCGLGARIVATGDEIKAAADVSHGLEPMRGFGGEREAVVASR